MRKIVLVSVDGTTPSETYDMSSAKECRAILDYLRRFYDMLDMSHADCDVDSDLMCVAQMVGEGNVREHEVLRDLNKLLEKIEAQ